MKPWLPFLAIVAALAAVINVSGIYRLGLQSRAVVESPKP